MTYREWVIWCAAFLDGEGSFVAFRDRRGYRSFSTNAGQKQLWPLEQLRRIFGGAVHVETGHKYGLNRWQACGARARGIMMMVYPFVSPRRQEQIRTALSYNWREPNGGLKLKPEHAPSHEWRGVK